MLSEAFERARSPLGLVWLGAAGLALVTVAGAQRLGVAALLLPVALAIGVPLLRRPELALGLVLGVAVLAESDPLGFLPTDAIYTVGIPGLTVFDLLVLGAVAVIAVDATLRRRAPMPPAPLAVGLVVLAAAMASGTVTGYFAGASSQALLSALTTLVYLIVVPLAVLAVVDTPARARRLLAIAAVLVAAKAALGIAAVAMGLGPAQLDGTRITYYEATPNWLTVLLLLGLVAARLRSVRLPAWTLLLWPLTIVAILLSYRRGFWIITVIGLAVVVTLGLSRLQRRLAVPALLVVLGLGYTVFTVAIPSGLDGPVVDRARSLTPSKVLANASDRYRIDERTNVVEELRRRPLTGLGIGIGWAAREPLGFSTVGGREYVHVAVLWFWLKLGVLGAVAYVTLLLAGIWMAVGVSRSHPDPRLACFGLATAATLTGLLGGELTATFTGVDARFTVVLAAVLGLLAALRAQSRAA